MTPQELILMKLDEILAKQSQLDQELIYLKRDIRELRDKLLEAVDNEQCS